MQDDNIEMVEVCRSLRTDGAGCGLVVGLNEGMASRISCSTVWHEHLSKVTDNFFD